MLLCTVSFHNLLDALCQMVKRHIEPMKSVAFFDAVDASRRWNRSISGISHVDGADGSVEFVDGVDIIIETSFL